MNILEVCAEYFPLVKVGGLADVTGALPGALAKLGCDTRALVPGIPGFMSNVDCKEVVHTFYDKFGVKQVNIIKAVVPQTKHIIYIVQADELYNRAGNPYVDANNQDYADSHLRFGLLSYAAYELATCGDKGWLPDIIHCHDWHTALTPLYVKAAVTAGQKHIPTVLTIHNLAFLGVFSKDKYKDLYLPDQYLNQDAIELNGNISFMKAGLVFADKLTTVSHTYAQEIQTKEYGCGVENLLQKRSADLTGIINGVDYAVWHPNQDTNIPYNYDSNSLNKKAECKQFIQQKYNLPLQKDKPLFVVVSRLTAQKGIDLIVASIPQLVASGSQLIVLGTGDHDIEQDVLQAAKQHPENIAAAITYNEALAHQIIAGGDVILVPSRFEPCGLTQLYGLIYGTVPLVNKVGGLADTVVDANNENIELNIADGVTFATCDIKTFNAAITKVEKLYANKKVWQQIQHAGMGKDFGWEQSAKAYLAIYKACNQIYKGEH